MIKYPYTDFHEINLDWIMEKTKESNDAATALLAYIHGMGGIAHVEPIVAPNYTRFDLPDGYRGIAFTVGKDLNRFTVSTVSVTNGVPYTSRMYPSNAPSGMPTITVSQTPVDCIRFLSVDSASDGTYVFLIDLVGEATLYVQ